MSLSYIKNNICSKIKIKKSQVYIWTLDIMFFIAIVILSVLYFAVKNHGYKDITYSLNNDFIKKIIYSSVNGEEICLEPSEFNAVLNNLILKNVEVSENIKSISAVLQKNNESLIFIPITYNGIDLEISLKSIVKFNSDNGFIEIKILKAQIGDLRVPVDILLNNINNEFIVYKDKTLFLKVEIPVELFNKKITVGIDNFYMDDGKVFLKFKLYSDELNNFTFKKLNNLFSHLTKHQIA